MNDIISSIMFDANLCLFINYQEKNKVDVEHKFVCKDNDNFDFNVKKSNYQQLNLRILSEKAEVVLFKGKGFTGDKVTYDEKNFLKIDELDNFAIKSVRIYTDNFAEEVIGDIRKRWESLGGAKGLLGYPLTKELDTPKAKPGKFNHFQYGSIYWTPQTGAHEIHGDIRNLWSSLGWEQGFLGFPLTDESTCPDGKGRFNHFQGGSIYWTPELGAHEVHGDIKKKWEKLKGVGLGEMNKALSCWRR